VFFAVFASPEKHRDKLREAISQLLTVKLYISPFKGETERGMGLLLVV
jgi:hypothetical protein